MEQVEQVQIQEQPSEFSLQDILLLLREYFIEVKRRWYFILPFLAAVGAYYAFQHRKEGIKYPAGVTFMVNEEQGEDPTNGVGALLKSFTGGGGKESSSLDKVLQLFKSKSIIEKSLFQKVDVDGNVDFVANHMINIYGLEKLCGQYTSNTKWLDPIRSLKTHSFKSGDKKTFTNEEKLILIVLYEAISGNPSQGIETMILPSIDDKSKIMSFGVTTRSQDLTIALIEGIFSSLSAFYVDQTVEKQTKIQEIVTAKRDSLASILSGADADLAKFEDSNRSLVWVTGELTKVKLQRKARIAEIMYSEVVRQVEMADFALRRKMPYVRVIDMAAKPLRPVKMSIARSCAITMMIGTILGIMFIILRKTIVDAWRKASEMIAKNERTSTV
jgi:uncharacterized protein involved in exopolysaccharide biosynthesis